MGTTSLGGELWGLDWQLKHTSLVRNWVRTCRPPPSPLRHPRHLGSWEALSSQRGAGPEEGGKMGGSEPAEIGAGWQGPGRVEQGGGGASTLSGP